MQPYKEPVMSATVVADTSVLAVCELCSKSTAFAFATCTLAPARHFGGRPSREYPQAPPSLLSANMASGFVGLSVAVTLQNPPNTVVYGVVAAVNPQTATLTLENGALWLL